MTETTPQPERPPFDIAAATAFVAATARTSGLTITADALQVAAAELAGSVERDGSGAFQYLAEAGAGAFQIVDGEVREIPVERHVANVLLKHTKPLPASVKVSAPEVPRSQIAPSPGHYNDFSNRIGPKAIAAADAKLSAEVAAWPNPFSKQHLNRTRQTVLRNRFPTLAAAYEAEANR